MGVTAGYSGDLNTTGGEHMDISAMSPESIPALSVMMSSAKVSNEVSASMLKKTLDVSEQGGTAMVQMMRNSMELSVNPSVGGNFDVSV